MNHLTQSGTVERESMASVTLDPIKTRVTLDPEPMGSARRMSLWRCDDGVSAWAVELQSSYYHWLTLQGYSSMTQWSYGAALKPFLRFLREQGVSEPSGITANVVAHYQVWLMDAISGRTGKKLRQHTYNARLTALVSWCRFLLKTHRLGVDPTATVKIPLVPPALLMLPTASEIRRLLSLPDTRTPSGFRDRVILEVLWSSAPRVSELLQLRPEDVNMEGLLTIRKGKGQTQRVVPVGLNALAWLREYMERVRLHLMPSEKETGLLFPVSVSRWEHRLKDYVQRSGIKGVTSHTFRHVLATEMLKKGADLRHVQEMLGHADISTTQRYTHILKEELQRVHDRSHPRDQGPLGVVCYRGHRHL